MSTKRVVIVGGGVIGLSLAFEMAQRGHDVALLDQDRVGRQASWAGAGILAPANSATAVHPLDQLTGLSNELHPAWSQRLMELTGINNGYSNCGGVYIARTVGDVATLAGSQLNWNDFEIENSKLSANELAQRVPILQFENSHSAIWVPGESQICNPRHLKALVAANEKLGVRIVESVHGLTVTADLDRSKNLSAGGESFAFDQVCFAAGVGTSGLLEQFGLRLPMIPVRGQMLLFKLPEMLWQPIINEGSRYIVPRRDGHVLVGSTTEEAGFDCRTTEDQIADLQTFAEGLIPQLTEANRIKAWAGLRPATFDGMPFIGRVSGCENVFVATGHFKIGLQLSTATAVTLADQMEGKKPQVDLSPFAVARMDENQSRGN